MYGLSALPLLAMGCFCDKLRSVCNRAAKLVDRSIIASGAEVLGIVVPRVVDLVLSSRRFSDRHVHTAARVIDAYRHGYTLSLLSRVLKGVESFSIVLESCREAAHSVVSRIEELGTVVVETLLTMLDADVLLLSTLSRSSLWRLLSIAKAVENELRELDRSLSTLSAIAAMLAEAWSRGRGPFNELLKLTSRTIRGVVEGVEPLLDTLAVYMDPDNEVVVRELLRVSI